MIRQSLYVKPEVNPKKSMAIFAVPKPFAGHIGIIQRNAIKSWTLLQPTPQIILFGDEEGVAAISRELAIQHVPKVKRNEYGTPMLDDIFAEVRKQATADVITYVNCDIILMSDFTLAVQTAGEEFKDFLLIGRRWNININYLWEFEAGWEDSLRQLVYQKGSLASHDAKDYFVFPRHLFAQIPEFAVGRGYWDTWMVNVALDRRYRLVDVSQVVTAVHQNHSYSHIQGGKNEAHLGNEAQRNQAIGKVTGSGTIAHSNWQLQPWQFKDLPRVSVIITSQNQAASIRQTVGSVLNQFYSDYEIIVVVDGSDIRTQVLLKSYGQQVRCVAQKQQGIVDARNSGLQVAQGELVIFLDGESCLLPGVLEEQVACFDEQASTLDLLLGGWQAIASDKLVDVEPWQKLPDLEDMHIWKLSKLWQPLSESVIMFRRERLQLVGGFDNALSQEAAMLDVVLRLTLLKGSRATWLSKPICKCWKRDINVIPNTTQVTQDMEILIDKFFQQPEIKEWMRLLEAKARSNIVDCV